MYYEKKRERRIRDSERMKAKAVKYAKQYTSLYAGDIKRAVKHADYLAVCSCSMCGNPRRYWGKPTMQEIKADKP